MIVCAAPVPHGVLVLPGPGKSFQCLLLLQVGVKTLLDSDRADRFEVSTLSKVTC